MKLKENRGNCGAEAASSYDPGLDKYAGKAFDSTKPSFVKTHKATIIAAVQKHRANSRNNK